MFWGYFKRKLKKKINSQIFKTEDVEEDLPVKWLKHVTIDTQTYEQNGSATCLFNLTKV